MFVLIFIPFYIFIVFSFGTLPCSLMYVPVDQMHVRYIYSVLFKTFASLLIGEIEQSAWYRFFV